MNELREKPIIFSAPMVNAILQGRKSVTRRLVKPNVLDYGWSMPPARLHDGYLHRFGCQRDEESIKCPWVVGMRAWVKETWSPDHAAFYPNFPTVYRADGEMEIAFGKVFSPESKSAYPFKWRSPRYMPRALSRINLLITDVRCEHIKEITGPEVAKEGFPFSSDLDQFKLLWDKLNGKGSWESNPLVWVIGFETTP